MPTSMNLREEWGTCNCSNSQAPNLTRFTDVYSDRHGKGNVNQNIDMHVYVQPLDFRTRCYVFGFFGCMQTPLTTQMISRKKDTQEKEKKREKKTNPTSNPNPGTGKTISDKQFDKCEELLWKVLTKAAKKSKDGSLGSGVEQVIKDMGLHKDKVWEGVCVRACACDQRSLLQQRKGRGHDVLRYE